MSYNHGVLTLHGSQFRDAAVIVASNALSCVAIGAKIKYAFAPIRLRVATAAKAYI